MTNNKNGKEKKKNMRVDGACCSPYCLFYLHTMRKEDKRHAQDTGKKKKKKKRTGADRAYSASQYTIVCVFSLYIELY